MRNYGILKKEHRDETLSDVTVKGAKNTMIEQLKTTLAKKQDRLKELRNEQKFLQSKGKDLDKEDLERINRLERIIADLKKTITEQTEMFGFSLGKRR